MHVRNCSFPASIIAFLRLKSYSSAATQGSLCDHLQLARILYNLINLITIILYLVCILFDRVWANNWTCTTLFSCKIFFLSLADLNICDISQNLTRSQNILWRNYSAILINGGGSETNMEGPPSWMIHGQSCSFILLMFLLLHIHSLSWLSIF